MLLPQSQKQVRKNQGITKWFPFHKSLNKRKMHLDTTRDFSGIAGKQTKISCLNKRILMSAIADRNTTCASTVHVLCIIQLDTAWTGYRRDFTAVNTRPKPLLTKGSPERWGCQWESKSERDFLSNSSTQGIFLPLLSLSLLCLWCALAGLWWLTVVELCVFWQSLNYNTQEEMPPWSFIWYSLFLKLQISAVQLWAHTFDSSLLIYFPHLSFALAILPPPCLLLTEHQAN